MYFFLFIVSYFSPLLADNTLVVGTNAEFPPFCYIEDNKIVGFDIDIANEVTQRLGKTIQIKDMPFDSLISEIALNHVDFAAAGMSYTEERAKRVSFTKSYLSNDPLVIFTMGTQKMNLEDLQGKKVVVIEGFTADLLMSPQKGIHLIRLPSQADGFMSVKNHRADAFITARSTATAFFEQQDASPFHITVLEGTGETCGLVVPKNKPDQLLAIENVLNEMEKDGTIAQLKIKWKLQ